MRKINTHIVHCSDSPSDLDIGAGEIRLWHIQEMGLSDIDCHFVIKRDGTLEKGRPIEIIGEHCKGHNKGSIGTCLIGGFHGMNDFTEEQLETLKELHLHLMDLFGNIHIYGHRDFNTKKTCPGFDVQSWWLLETMKGHLFNNSAEKEEIMKNTKSIFASRTFYGIVITILGASMGFFGYEINQTLQTDTADAVSAFVSAGGALLALYGRWKATKKIG